MIKVRAKELGYYGHARRRVGNVFNIEHEREFSKKWMERVVDDSPVTPPQAVGPINKDNVPDTPMHIDPNNVRQPIAPSELAPASILNVPAKAVIESLRAMRQKGIRVERLKVIGIAERKGKGRITVLDEIDSMIKDITDNTSIVDAPI